MNKKIIIILVIVLVLVLAGGFFGYQYMATSSVPELQDINNEVPNANTNINVNDNANADVEIGGVTVTPTSGNGTLSICSDQCGDGICQSQADECNPDDFSCICLESKKDCPQDCK